LQAHELIGTPTAAPSLTMATAKYAHAFFVPLVTYLWPDSGPLNEKLRARILAHAATDQGMQATNVGGWHSANGQLEFLGELREPLLQRMLLMTNEATRTYVAEVGLKPVSLQWSFLAWANVSRKGDFNTTHTHPGMTWSGVYYVDTGVTPGQNDSGALRFSDPTPGSAASFLPFAARICPEILPVPGLMVLFPSYLPHFVHPHRGNGLRISIAFNFRNEPYP
jgi:uncharacterized protein (TIGR02466 family)